MKDTVFQCMAKAYIKTHTRFEAVDLVKEEFPTAEESVLESIWYAIDAYVELTTS